ncbi:hypothetical protein [Litoreibacter arenae]|uniref:Uncharacterized protein n=1 Tax=Litoreibacter arenae DSM 19593 TaxID=1123360 RepID=S9S619_9RHOB|nr:hypothetical protein [Litoreibacter arenae]EPX81649.1 hypothetical protein thalar_00205 [Litoreibacter arenae DSM 19593]
MDHKNLQPLKGASAREKTAFTMKTIKELLAEETESAKNAEAKPVGDTSPAQAAEEPAPRAAPVENTAPVEAVAPQEEASPSDVEPNEQAIEAPRSFLGRLIGR